MVVEDGDPSGLAEISSEYRFLLATRPGRRSAAEPDSLGIGVLPAAHSLLERCHPVLLRIGCQDGACRRSRLIRPALRNDGVAQFLIFPVLRQRLCKIDPIAVQIDVLLRGPPQPGETTRVDCMYQEDSNPLRQP